MKVYVDSSVVLRWLLQQPGAIQNWGGWELAVTSELTRVETRRSLDRFRLQGKLSGEDAARTLVSFRLATEGFKQIRIQPAILERAASPLSTVLGTLDAIHLATALAWIEESGDTLTFLTHDRELAIAATACELDVLPRPAFLSG